MEFARLAEESGSQIRRDAVHDTTGARFLAELEAAFRRARSALHPVVEHRLRIGGTNVTLQFAGSELVRPFTRAFAHLPVHPAETPDLCVRLWETDATGSPPPAPPWGQDRYVARGEIEHALGGDIRATFSVDSGLFLCLDLSSAVAHVWVRNAAALRPWDLAAPLRPLLGWWFRARGAQLVHGAAVGTDRGSVLLAARGGSGKSASALECARAGMNYLSDDYALLRQDTPEPSVWSVYQSAKITRAHRARAFPELSGHVVALETGRNDGGLDKDILYVNEVYPGRLPESLPLRAIVVPRLAEDGATRVRRARGPEILTALAPTTLFQLPGAGADSLRFMARIVERVPGYALELGRDPQAVTAILRDLADGNGALP